MYPLTRIKLKKCNTHLICSRENPEKKEPFLSSDILVKKMWMCVSLYNYNKGGFRAVKWEEMS